MNIPLNEIVDILNSSRTLNAVPISKIFDLISEYLQDTYPEKEKDTIKFLSEHLEILQFILPTVFTYIENKYNICSIIINNTSKIYYL